VWECVCVCVCMCVRVNVWVWVSGKGNCLCVCHEGVYIQFQSLDAGERSASLYGRYIRRKRCSDIHWMGRRVGPAAGLNVLKRRKTSFSFRESKHYFSYVRLIISRYVDCALPVNCVCVCVLVISEVHKLREFIYLITCLLCVSMDWCIIN
jgi:hypothetical protein